MAICEAAGLLVLREKSMLWECHAAASLQWTSAIACEVEVPVHRVQDHEDGATFYNDGASINQEIASLRSLGCGVATLDGAVRFALPYTDHQQSINRAELSAIILAVRIATGRPIIVVTDSMYCMKGFDKIKNGALHLIGAHLDLWTWLSEHVASLELRKIKSHLNPVEVHPDLANDVIGNNMADELAGQAAKTCAPPLRVMQAFAQHQRAVFSVQLMMIAVVIRLNCMGFSEEAMTDAASRLDVCLRKCLGKAKTQRQGT
eukprot:4133162-Amphidinium_carterae.1